MVFVVTHFARFFCDAALFVIGGHGGRWFDADSLLHFSCALGRAGFRVSCCLLDETMSGEGYINNGR